jgi:hypothetical protein
MEDKESKAKRGSSREDKKMKENKKTRAKSGGWK